MNLIFIERIAARAATDVMNDKPYARGLQLGDHVTTATIGFRGAVGTIIQIIHHNEEKRYYRTSFDNNVDGIFLAADLERVK